MKILSRPRGNAEEYGRWSVNPYLGCPNDCAYCYLKKGPGAKTLGGDKPMLKIGVVSEEHAYHLAMAEILENREQIIRDGGLFMTFTSDPCIKETRSLMFRIVNECIGHGMTPKEKIIPVTLLTKDADFCGWDIEVLDSMEKMNRIRAWMTNISMSDPKKTYDRLAVGWTLTGHDELEPNASPNGDRIKAMAYLSSRGYRTWASIEPVVTFDASMRMIEQALDAGCRHLKIGLMTSRTKVCRHGFSLGGHDFAPYDLAECCQFVGYVMELAGRYHATVYWKQSVCDLLQQSEKHPQPVHGMTAREFLSQWPHSVGKDWSMFGNDNDKK